MGLQVQNWDTILILGLELDMLNCHIKGLQMLQFMRFLPVNFQIFVSIKAIFFQLFLSIISQMF